MEQQTKDPRIQVNTAIANDIIAHVASDPTDDAAIWDKHWSPGCVSVEGDGSVHEGRAAMDKKYEWWYDTVTMHSCVASGPWVGPEGFAIKYTIDCEAKDGSWPRMKMDEIAYYTVSEGKVVREQFMSNPADCADA
ncbi:MAG: SnoaL-like domain-containing protein [Planctomycetota bacterium]